MLNIKGIIKDKIIIHDVDHSNIYTTNCNSHPKKCTNKNCDCSQLCNSPNAKKIEIKNEKYENEQYLTYTDGTYCYIPVGNSCKSEFGTWINKNWEWECVPKFYGIFTSDGDQLVGKYPYADSSGQLSVKNKNKINVDYNNPKEYEIDCSKLKDEYGKTLLTFTLDSGMSFCLKDYCISNLKDVSTSGYKNGECICKGGSENILMGDLTSPCVVKGEEKNTIYKPFYSFQVGCFDKNTYVKDLENYLFQCPDDSENNFLNSNKILITTSDL